jgi:hypothetical protein
MKVFKNHRSFLNLQAQAFFFLLFFYSPVGLAKDIHVRIYIHAWGLIKSSIRFNLSYLNFIVVGIDEYKSR